MGKKAITGIDYPLKKTKRLEEAMKSGDKTGHVAVMSPEEFLHHANRLKGTKEDKLLIDAFKDGMKKGKKFKPLKLLAHNRADGRHRATAAEELGIEEIPVIDYRKSGLKKIKGAHTVGEKMKKTKKEVRQERAAGGPVLPLGSDDPNDAFRRLISWSFAVAPMFGRAEGGRILQDEFPTHYLPNVGRQVMADGGIADIEAAIRAAEEASKKKEESHEKGVSGAVEFAPIGVTEPLSGARLPLGSLPKETARVVEPALQTASEVLPYFTPAAPIAAARDVAVGLREGDPSNVALSALGLPGKAAKAAAIGASALMPSEAEAGPIDKALGVARRLTELGHYSPSAEAAAALKQEKGPASQMIGTLKNIPGVKSEELKWSGIEGAFQPSEPVTRQQIMDYLHENLPQIKETTLSNNLPLTRDEARINEKIEEMAASRAHNAGDIDHLNDWENASPETKDWHRDAARDEFEEKYMTHYADKWSKPSAEPPKYEQYTLPGGENYREVLLHTPSRQEKDYAFEWFDPATQTSKRYPTEELARQNAPKGSFVNKVEVATRNQDYKSSHWDEPNVLGHLRMSDRTGPEGEKILHLEELQSDWGQQAHKEGIKNVPALNEAKSRVGQIQQEEKQLKEQINELSKHLPLDDLEGFLANDPKVMENYHSANAHILDKLRPLDERLNELQRERLSLVNQMEKHAKGVPEAPHITSTQGWTDLGLKRALKEAAEGGYDKLIWTPGAEQAPRYDLSKHIDEIFYKNGNLIAYDPNGHKIIQQTGLPREQLSDYIGKEAAEKLLAQEKDKEGWHWLDSEGLKIGGEGMEFFYDKILPTQLQKLVKKLDPNAKIEMGAHKLPKGKSGKPEMAHVLHITPELRKRILEGLPAFERGGSIVDHALDVVSKHSQDAKRGRP